MGAGGSVQENNLNSNSSSTSWESNPKDYGVSLVSSERFKMAKDLPPKFTLHIGYESLDFVNTETKSPIIQFPFQNIICWGSNTTVFRFNVFDYENMGKEDISIILKTTFGKQIEDTTMGTVRHLMVDMETKTISKEEFSELLPMIIDVKNNTLRVRYLLIVKQENVLFVRCFLFNYRMDG